MACSTNSFLNLCPLRPHRPPPPPSPSACLPPTTSSQVALSMCVRLLCGKLECGAFCSSLACNPPTLVHQYTSIFVH
eukprot:7227869-Pyramimonas_sp.AAC.2